MPFFSSSRSSSSTVNNIRDQSARQAFGNLDARGGTLINVSGNTGDGAIDIIATDQGAVEKALALAAVTLDEGAGLARFSIDQARTSDETLRELAVIVGVALAGYALVRYAS